VIWSPATVPGVLQSTLPLPDFRLAKAKIRQRSGSVTIQGLFHESRIAGPVIHDLKVQKVMHGLQRFGIVCGDPYLSASIRGLESVGDRIVFHFHRWYTGRHGVVNKHRDVEVIGAEHSGDVRKVRPDLIAGGSIVIGLYIDLDDSAIGQECKMMRRGFV